MFDLIFIVPIYIGYTIGDHLKGTVDFYLECKYIFKLSNVQPNLNCWDTNKVWRTPFSPVVFI